MFDPELESSSQTTLILPSAATASCAPNDPAVLVAKSTGAENVAPPSVEWLNRTPNVMLSLSQTTLMFPLPSTANCGLRESAGSLERFSGTEKVPPPSVERLKKTSLLPGASLIQTTLIPP